MIPQLGPLEIVVVVLVALLVFGPKRLPEVGRQVGRGLREVKKLQEQVSQELHQVLHSDDPEDPFSGLTDFVSRVGGAEDKRIDDVDNVNNLDDSVKLGEDIPQPNQPLSDSVTNSDLRISRHLDQNESQSGSAAPSTGQAPSKYRPPAAD
ncbi:MAG: hypothetical protein F2894_00070 [Actinobacteria bacterium]|uniref:Unannotated protein n=1 Tax=freshwater metagenome TaxID=449393 RepID=A0A6J7P8I6_9ZZZZ|nr:hypothetical protein [Actinomycetota bacterium]MSW04585.1 hypothetical protein [Actinomycetota bacterium]MSX32084.1 hypothetical protein [Actinomycetota bacterium]MSX81190.1 hypothetical protein [Actinomycetota bacterium]MSY05800.1 hypothetical protein [Actinomycetota bacterium]